MRKTPIAFERSRLDRLPATPAPAYDWRSPLRYALLRSLAVIVALSTVATIGGLVWAYAGEPAPWLLALAAVALVVGATFTAALWAATNAVKRATWDQERRQGVGTPAAATAAALHHQVFGGVFCAAGVRPGGVAGGVRCGAIAVLGRGSVFDNRRVFRAIAVWF